MYYQIYLQAVGADINTSHVGHVGIHRPTVPYHIMSYLLEPRSKYLWYGAGGVTRKSLGLDGVRFGDRNTHTHTQTT